MEISREDIDEAIDVADSRFPKRAAAFLAGRDAFFGDDVDPDARKENSDDSEKRNENEDVGDDVTQKRHTSRGRSWTLDPSAVGEDSVARRRRASGDEGVRGRARLPRLVLDEALRVFFKPSPHFSARRRRSIGSSSGSRRATASATRATSRTPTRRTCWRSRW